ncbi:MAG: hypothetical protein AB8B36_09080 [Prochlorococcus sp.]
MWPGPFCKLNSSADEPGETKQSGVFIKWKADDMGWKDDLVDAVLVVQFYECKFYWRCFDV